MRCLVVSAAALAVAASLLSGSAQGQQVERPSELRDPVVAAAIAALGGARVEGPSSVRPSPTIALRDLAYVRATLSGRDREIADSLLARPTDPGDPYSQFYGDGIDVSSRCFETFCLTWASEGTDAPDLTDSNADGVPNWVDTTRGTIASVLATYGAAGLRAPLLDFGAPEDGTSTAFDVYLADLGPDGLYGYCVPDVDNFAKLAPGYCVLDNDFSTEEFGGSPELTLGVTAAHEIMHAVQFAYDATEAPWFLESVATFAEDELYDASDDNLQYLASGPLGRPTLSLDHPDPFGANRYGAWIFWRFLSEKLGQPGLAGVRSVLEGAGVGGGLRDLDALKSTRQYVESRGRGAWPTVFTGFVTGNRRPGSTYSEGASYPTAPTQQTYVLSKSSPVTKRRGATLAHLSAYHVDLRPGRGVKGAWTVQLTLDGPPRSSEIRAAVSVTLKSGAVRVSELLTDARGNASKRFAFNPAQVAKVSLTMVNAGTRYNCDPGLLTDYSCGGVSLDDGRRVSWSATAVRPR